MSVGRLTWRWRPQLIFWLGGRGGRWGSGSRTRRPVLVSVYSSVLTAYYSDASIERGETAGTVYGHACAKCRNRALYFPADKGRQVVPMRFGKHVRRIARRQRRQRPSEIACTGRDLQFQGRAIWSRRVIRLCRVIVQFVCRRVFVRSTLSLSHGRIRISAVAWPGYNRRDPDRPMRVNFTATSAILNIMKFSNVESIVQIVLIWLSPCFSSGISFREI